MNPTAAPSRAPGSSLRLLAVTRKPDSSSFEHRVRRFVEPLARRGIEVQCAHFDSSRRGRREVIRRMGDVDAVWWHRHLVQPLWIRRWRNAARCIGFDFDDPVCFSPRRPDGTSRVRAFKFRTLLRRCDLVLAASDYLADLARPHCGCVSVVPMAVDLPAAPPPPLAQRRGEALLWVGSAATQPYLEGIRPALERLGASHPEIALRLVAHAPMTFGPLAVSFRPWSPAEEADALRECQIGLCPMPETPWTRGKCPYKVLQYMASGMPWIGSAVGENIPMAAGGPDQAATGCCAATTAEWIDQLERLVDEPGRRASLGQCGLAFIRATHAREQVADRLATIWRDAVIAAAPGTGNR